MPPKSSMKQAQIQAFSVKEEGDHETRWRPDSCWSWLVCAASGILLVIVSGIRYSFGLLLPPLIDNFETTRQAAGGWLLVSSVVTKGPTPPKVSVETSYRGISGDQMVLAKDAMNDLRTHLSFTQLRFHCSKLKGRTFHVTTVANRTGEAVVQYFSGQTNVQPVSCGSFYRIEDDNSGLARNCEKWGNERGSYLVGKWGHGGDQSRLYDHPAFVKVSYHWLISGSRWECDDYQVGLSTGDFWKVFAR